jgi:hypothetical protein
LDLYQERLRNILGGLLEYLFGFLPQNPLFCRSTVGLLERNKYTSKSIIVMIFFNFWEIAIIILSNNQKLVNLFILKFSNTYQKQLTLVIVMPSSSIYLIRYISLHSI